jgi:hypothetical protein
MMQWRKKFELRGQLVFLPGLGRLRDGVVLYGDQYERYYPEFLERVSSDHPLSVVVNEPVEAPAAPSTSSERRSSGGKKRKSEKASTQGVRKRRK